MFLCFFVWSLRSGSAGRVMLSKEDKEAAKMGLSVFTVQCQSHCPWKVQKQMEKGKKLCPTLGIFYLKTNLGIAAQRPAAVSCVLVAQSSFVGL